MKLPIVIVGGGAAGIIAAWKATEMGAKVVLIEKTPRLGTKILMSGGGKCNITHDGPIERVLKEFRKNEALFLRPSVYKFTNQQVLEIFHEVGFETYTRPNGRVFPLHSTAKGVMQVLTNLIDSVEIKYEKAVLNIEKNFIIETDQEAIESKHVIVSTGGSSYPKSGTTGDGWKWLRNYGHRTAPIRAALAPIDLKILPEYISPGVSARDCILKARQNGKEIARWREDVLWTHTGVSGPCALGISREVDEALVNGPVKLEIDLVPKINFDDLSHEFLALKSLYPKVAAKRLADLDVADSILEQAYFIANINPERVLQDISKKEVHKLIETIKAFPLGEVDRVPLTKGEVVAGGIRLDEVDAQTMESKLVPNLFICGEILDIAGPVGGYNLQAAFSTGYVAGENAALSWLNS